MKIRFLSIAGLLISAMFIHPAIANQKDAKMKEKFFSAITKGDAAGVKEMLKSDASLAQAKDEDGTSAILKAVYFGKKDVVAVLLESGIDLNIFEASATGQTERVRALIKSDSALVNAFASDGFFALGLAVFFGHAETVDLLIDAGAEVNMASRESMKVTPLHSAVAARQLTIARKLIAHGADVNARAENGFTPLQEASANGDIEFAKLLLENGAEINAKANNGKTPLAFALARKRDEMAEFLRARGAVQ